MSSGAERNPLQDRDLLLRILDQEKQSRNLQTQLMWESIKFFYTLTAALIAVDIGLWNLFHQWELQHSQAIVMSSFLPPVILAASWYGRGDLKGRWKRVLEAIANCAKLENALNLHVRIDEGITVLTGDHYLLSPRWIEGASKFTTTEAFIKCNLRGDNMYSRMLSAYAVLFVMAIVLLVVPFVLFPLS